MNQSEKSEKSKRDIALAAYEMIRVGKTPTIRSVARASGMSVGNIYYHFKDMNEIGRYIIHQQFILICDIIDRRKSASDPVFRYLASEVISTLFSLDEPESFNYFLSQDIYFTTLSEDYRRILISFGIVLDSDEFNLRSLIFTSSMSACKKALIRKEIGMNVYEALFECFAMNLTPLGIRKEDLSKWEDEIMEIAATTTCRSLYFDWMQDSPIVQSVDENKRLIDNL